MSVTGTPISGTDGKILYGATEVFGDKWTVTPATGDIPTPNYGGGGFDEGLTGGLKSAEFQFEGFFDAANPPFSVLGLTSGNQTTALKLFVSRTNNSFFNFPKWRLLKAPVVSEVDNKVVRITINGKSDGPWFYPA